MKKSIYTILAAGILSSVSAGNFDISLNGTAVTATYNGQQFVTGNLIKTGSLSFGGEGVQTQLKKLENGKAINIWNEHPERKFRQEFALAENGKHLEITYLSESRAFQPHRARVMQIEVPFELFAGANYTARVGRCSKVKTVTGKIPADLKSGKSLLPAYCRQIAFSGSKVGNLVIDFNVLGAGDFLSDYSNGAIKGFGAMIRKGDKVEISSGTLLPAFGGHVGAKWRFYAGSDSDFHKYHAINKIAYTTEFPQKYLYSFGGNPTGDKYTNIGNAPYDGSKKIGWVKNAPKLLNQSLPGAYYGAAAGKDGIIKIGNLNPGLFWITIGIGNFWDQPNNFGIAFNGKKVLDNISVPNKSASIIQCAVWVDKNEVELQLSGNYLISTLGLAAVMAKPEDASINRGIWMVDGYEPAEIYRNEHYKKPVKYAASVQNFALPEPGREEAAAAKPIKPAPSAGNPDRPNMKWRYSAKISAWGPGNQGTLIEYAEPEAMQKRLDELQSKGVNAILVSSMLSRHTYFAHLERAEKFIKTLCTEAHKRNMKVIDHQDLTLLWNIDAGYRIGSERIGETNVAIDSMQPAPQFCLVNPEFKAKYTKYLKDFVRNTNLDCIMIDETNFYPHGCGCGHCRNAFFKATNWHLPVNELDERLGDKDSELWKRFLLWHKQQIGQWWYDLKMAVREVNPDFSFMAYSTHYGFTHNWSSLALGLDLTEYAKGVDFLGTEIMTRDVLYSHRGLIPYRKMKEVLTHEYNTPIFGLVYSVGNWDQGYFGWAVNNMNGQSTWETIEKCPAGKSDYPAFVSDNMDYSTSKRVAEAALLFPIQSREWNKGVSMLSELMGTAQVLETLHIPYKMIGDMSLYPAKLQGFKLLFIGSANCLSDDQLKAIKDFARQGGTVITGATAGWQDEIGNLRSKWGFADVYGYDIIPVQFKKFTTLPDSDQKTAVKYNLVPSANGQYGSCQIMSYADKAQRYPAVLEKAYGKGKFIHHAAMLTSALAAGEYRYNSKYTFKLDKALQAYCQKLLKKEFANADANLQITAPELVYSTWYRTSDAEIIHLLNASGGVVPYGTLLNSKTHGVAYPALTQDITVTLPLQSVKEVYAASPDFAGRKALQFNHTDGKLTVTLPKELLKAYTLIWIKK